MRHKEMAPHCDSIPQQTPRGRATPSQPCKDCRKALNSRDLPGRAGNLAGAGAHGIEAPTSISTICVSRFRDRRIIPPAGKMG